MIYNADALHAAILEAKHEEDTLIAEEERLRIKDFEEDLLRTFGRETLALFGRVAYEIDEKGSPYALFQAGLVTVSINGGITKDQKKSEWYVADHTHPKEVNRRLVFLPDDEQAYRVRKLLIAIGEVTGWV